MAVREFNARKRTGVSPAAHHLGFELSIFLTQLQPGGIFVVGRFQRQIPATEESCVGLRGGIAGRFVVARTPSRGQRSENDSTDKREHDSLALHRAMNPFQLVPVLRIACLLCPYWS